MHENLFVCARIAEKLQERFFCHVINGRNFALSL
jgi:hypothetical protein